MSDITQFDNAKVTHYVRAKINQLLELLGTLPLRPEELDDDTLIDLDPIGIIADSFKQVLDNLQTTNNELAIAKNELRAIFDSMGAAIVVLNVDMKIEDCNRLASSWFFRDAELSEVVGKPLSEVCRCFSSCGCEDEFNVQPRASEFLCDGQYFLRISSDVLNDDGSRENRVFLFFDLTRQKETESDLRLYETVFNNTAEGIAITDKQRRFIRVNDAFCTITGYRADELIGQQPEILKSGRHDTDYYEQMWQQLDDTGKWQGEIIDRTKEGRVLPLLQTINVIKDREGNISNYFSIITDITALKETQLRLNFLAHHDILTELPNRLLFNARLDHAIDHAERNHEQFALLFIDLDRFKTINDSLGHGVGDQVLIQVALRLHNLLRRVDTVARLGGDEFVILIEQLHSSSEAEALADKVVHAIKQPYIVGDHELHIGCSIGITIYPNDGQDSVILLRNADTAMYQVKASGRDGYHLYTSELSDVAHERLSLESGLRIAIRDRQLNLYYQPIIDLPRRRIVAAEALVRWQHPERGLILPDTFIPLAEESKLILPLGEWVSEEAIAQLATWQHIGIRLDYISINTSSVQLFHPGFADKLIHVLKQHTLGNSRLQVELTENMLLRDIESCRHIMKQLRDHGVTVAIDDFGTGYSSFTYLKQLPIDDLKIDQSFIRDLTEDSNDAAIVKAIIGMADTLGLKTVAEGVENQEQERFLNGIGCCKAQGYYYANPMPAKDFVEFYSAFNVSGADRYLKP